MKALLFKEFQMTFNWKTFVSYIALLFLIGTIFGHIQVALFVFTFALMHSSILEDDINDADVFINSLPVSRRMVVASKFLATMIEVALMLGTVYGSKIIVPLFSDLNWQTALLTFAGALILIGFYYTCYYVFGLKLLNVILVILFIMATVVFPILLNLNYLTKLIQIIQFLSEGIGLVIATSSSLLLVIVFYVISYKVYQRKEF
ncbi:ABC-2 transporter permease [Dolosigranulum pigrum]|uniref:ABC-2 transporter permease n=1 Tax=Dolosigranulum pigrum TaxID=29394 RepID=UPI00248B1586|nr:ABC-2 transporter permease [Dolosigranulum pigrum]